MNTLTLPSLFNPDFEKRFFDTFLNISETYKPFLPYNLFKDGKNIVLELAVAGYSRDNLKVSLENNYLIISGKKDDDSNTNYEFKYRGLSKKNFAFSWSISSLYDIDSVELENGILKIIFVPNKKLDTKVLEIKEK